MKQKLLKPLRLRVFMLVALLCAGFTSAWGEDVIVSFISSTDVGTGGSAQGQNSIEKGGITISCDAGGFAINGGAHYRLGSGSTTTISSTVGNIKSIVFNGPTGTGDYSISQFDSNEGWTLDKNKGTYTWNGDAESVTVKAKLGQVRPTSIVVTYTPKVVTAYTVTLGDDNTPLIESAAGAGVALPSRNNVWNYTFAGWSETALGETETAEKPTIISVGTYYPKDNVTLYPVYTRTESGTEEVIGQTLKYDTWTYQGSTTDKTSYRLFHKDSYIESTTFELSTLSKVIVYGGTFGGASYNSLTISDGINIWVTGTVSGSSQTGENVFTSETALSGTGKLRITSNSGTASSTGVRISKVDIFVNQPAEITYYVQIPSEEEQKEDAGLSFSSQTCEATLNATNTFPTLTNPNDLAVTYSSSDENVATIDEAGAVTLKTAGTTIITASSAETATYAAGSASYALTVVDPNAGDGSEEKPYSVAEAIKFINTLGTSTSTNDVYVKGIISKIDSYNSTYKSITYWISDDGTTTTQMEVYSGKGLEGADFSSKEDLQKGDKVTVCGKVKLYGSIYEFDKNSIITSYEPKVLKEHELAFSAETATAERGQAFTTPTLSNPNNLDVTYKSSKESVATVAEDGTVTLLKAGTTTITASFAGDDDYKAGEVSYTLTVTVPSHNITFFVNGVQQGEPVSIAEDEAITFPEATQEINGKTFVGWTTGVLEGEQAAAPTTLVKAATMGTSDVTYYAVYANVEGESKTATLTANDDFGTTYTAKEFTDDQNNLWVAVCNSTTKEEIIVYGLTKNDKNPYIQSPVFDGNITEIKVWAFNGSSTKDRTFILKNGEEEVGSIPVAASSSNSELSASLIGTTFSQFTMTASDALQFSKIAVTYGNATYSDYCTTVKELATIRLYLPNNPEGNLTEHQLSCSSAVILNVDTNSPGAITIQDMTDGITVIPNTENKTVTLLASTNNGKVFSQPGEYTFRVVVGETDSYTSASVDFKLKVVKFRAYFNNLTGFEETKDLANGTNGGQLKDQLISNTQWGDASYKTWTSTNEDVATIDNDGNITLIRTGQVRFTHSYTGNDYNEPCKISTGVMTVIDTTPTVLPTAPTIFHDSGEYEGELKVAIAGEGTIMYTLNDGEAQTYSAPFTIKEDATIKAWAVKDGVASDVTEPKTFTIKEKAKGAVVEDGYYTIKTNDDKYVNVAGRKAVTLVEDTKSAGTVIRVKADEDGVKVLRSQAVDLPRYAERAMSYVPELVKELMKRLSENVENPIIGEDGANLITDEVMDLDYNLYLEEADGGYRIYGKTPSMQRVVDFYATNKTIIDERLPRLEEFVEDVLLKVAERLDHPNSEWASKFKILDIWAKLVVTNPDLTKPEEGNAEAISKFYTEILSSEANVWNFAHETMMIYWTKVEKLINPDPDSDSESDFADMLENLGDYKKYLEKVPNILPNFKYYIVSDGSGIDFISEGNEDIINNAARTVWTLTPRTEFDVTFLKDNALSSGRELYTTLYTDFAYKLPDGVKAYAITGVNETTGVATKEEFPSNIIPAQTPVLLQATFDAEQTADQTKTLELTTEAGTTPETNLLVGADELINQYEINSSTAVTLLDMLSSISQSLADQYSYLARKNAGTVNNKYFFGLTEDDLNLCTYKLENGSYDCIVRSLSTGNEKVGFYNNWEAKANQAFLINEINPVKLFLKGDVYRDGVIDNKDLTALVEIVLGKVTLENKPENYDFDAAHVNDDEDINIADVTALVNILK